MSNYTEWIGYVAMLFLMISFIPKQLHLIRVLNLFGCIFFVAYGILLGWQWPIIISNGFIALIQIYHIIKNRKNSEK